MCVCVCVCVGGGGVIFPIKDIPDIIELGLSYRRREVIFPIIPAHSNSMGQIFLEDKIHGFKYTYISDEHIVQQTEWYHSSIVLRKVHQFIIKNPCATLKKPFYKTHGLQRRSIQNTINPGIRFTIWKTIGFRCFKEQQKGDFCRTKTSLHVLCGLGRRGKVTSFEARTLRGTNYYWGIPIGSQKTRNRQNTQTDRLYTPAPNWSTISYNKQRRVPVSRANTEHKSSELGKHQATHKT